MDRLEDRVEKSEGGEPPELGMSLDGATSLEGAKVSDRASSHEGRIYEAHTLEATSNDGVTSVQTTESSKMSNFFKKHFLNPFSKVRVQQLLTQIFYSTKCALRLEG